MGLEYLITSASLLGLLVVNVAGDEPVTFYSWKFICEFELVFCSCDELRADAVENLTLSRGMLPK